MKEKKEGRREKFGEKNHGFFLKKKIASKKKLKNIEIYIKI